MSRRGKTESPARRPLRAPTHPGALLREDVLPAIGEAVAGAAKKLGVTRRHLHRILAEKAPISPEMAIRLGKFCGNGPSFGFGCNRPTTCATLSRPSRRRSRRYRPRSRGRHSASSRYSFR